MAEYVKIPELAHRLDVSEKTARRYVRSGVLPSVFIGGAYRVSEDDVAAFLRNARVSPGKALAPPPSTQPSKVVGDAGLAENIIGEILKAAGAETRWATFSDEEWSAELEGASAEQAMVLYDELLREREATMRYRWDRGKEGTSEEKRAVARMLARYFMRGFQAASAAKNNEAEAKVGESLEEELAQTRE